MEKKFKQTLATLIARIDGERRQRGNRRVSLAQFDGALIAHDGVACDDTVLVGYVTDLILRDRLKLDDFLWAEKHLALLAHVALCESCLLLTLLDETADECIEPTVEAAIERMKTSTRVPEKVRDLFIQHFGAPKLQQPS